MADIDWQSVRRVLVVKLRSIGDTVLVTPTLDALRRALPEAEIDILLEEWVAPVLDGLDDANVIPIGKTFGARLRTISKLRQKRYDVAFNLHGGTTATLLARASGAKHRVGFGHYQFPFLYTHLLSSSADFWGTDQLHSAEQQLALAGFVGIAVADRPKSRLTVTESARESIEAKIPGTSPIALIHPAAAFATKQWAVEHFARTAEYLASLGFVPVAVAADHERHVLDGLTAASRVPVLTFDGLSLPEITALAARAAVFVGNDSGIAHIAAAVAAPTVVIFGSSNRVHWRPWTDAPYRVVYAKWDCQPCPGYHCSQFTEPECIKAVTVDQVMAAIGEVLEESKRERQIKRRAP